LGWWNPFPTEWKKLKLCSKPPISFPSFFRKESLLRILYSFCCPMKNFLTMSSCRCFQKTSVIPSLEIS
jgi:hypothetical protein